MGDLPNLYLFFILGIMAYIQGTRLLLIVVSLHICLFQEPRHLQLLADLEDSNIFTVVTGKKQHSAPTDYGFCIKVRLRLMRPVANEILSPEKCLINVNVKIIGMYVYCCIFKMV